MKQDQYKRVLETRRLVPQLEECFPEDEKCTFVHALSHCHKGKKVYYNLGQSKRFALASELT